MNYTVKIQLHIIAIMLVVVLVYELFSWLIPEISTVRRTLHDKPAVVITDTHRLSAAASLF